MKRKIQELQHEIENYGSDQTIDDLENDIAKSIKEASKEEKTFYKLPITNIIRIIEKSNITDYTLLVNITKQLVKYKH